MDRMKCPFCKGEVDGTAVTCRHCGATKDRAGLWTSKDHKGRPLKGDGTPGGVHPAIPVVVLIGVVLVAGYVWSVFSAPDPAVTAKDSVEAACISFIMKTLPDPPSAGDFPTPAVVTNTGTTYKARGPVNVSNGVGGKVRRTYSCTVVDSGDSWRLVDLSGLD